MSLVLVRNSMQGLLLFLRTPTGKAVLLLGIEAALRHARRVRHPATAAVTGTLQALIAFETISVLRTWLAQEVPALLAELRRLSAHNDDFKVFQSILDAFTNALITATKLHSPT